MRSSRKLVEKFKKTIMTSRLFSSWPRLWRWLFLGLSKYQDNLVLTIGSNRSNEGLTLETSAFESRYGGRFTLSTQLMEPNYLVILPTDAAHSFFRNLLSLFLVELSVTNNSWNRTSELSSPGRSHCAKKTSTVVVWFCLANFRCSRCDVIGAIIFATWWKSPVHSCWVFNNVNQ